MKKIISAFLCLLLLSAMCFAFSSCNPEREDTPDPKVKGYENALVLLANCDYVGAKAAFEALGDYRDAKEYLSKFYYMPVSFEYDLVDKKGTNDIAYNGINLPISENTMRPDVQAISKFVYDDNGNIIEQILILNTDGEPEISRYVYTYDSNGHLITGNYTSHDGYTSSYTYEYDDRGNNVKQTYVDEYSVYEYTMIYDANGNITSQVISYNGGSDVFNTAFSYDDNGNVIREVDTYSDGTQEYRDYIYDEKGSCIREVFTDLSGAQSIHNFTYDRSGNVVEEIFTDTDGSVQYVKTKYELLYIPCGITDGTDYFFRGLWSERL